MDTINDWKKTDPDNFQFGRELRGGVYEFKEFDRQTFREKFQELRKIPYEKVEEIITADFDNVDFWKHERVNLADYTEQELEDHISSYYNDLDEVKEIYGDEWMFIVAECIFEQESGLY